MSLQAQFDKIKSELEAKKQRLIDETTEADTLKAEAKTLKNEATKKIRELNSREKELEARENVMDQVDALGDKEQEVLNTLTQLKTDKLKLIKWENRLVEIEKRHEIEDQDMAIRVKEQEGREKNYKEEIKEKFLKQLKKQLK